MSLLKNISGFLLFFLTFSALFSSCCKETQYRIVDLEPIVVLHTRNNLNGEVERELAERIERTFSFEVLTENELVSPRTYSGNCGTSFENNLLLHTLSLSCDRPFYFDSRIVEADFNFIRLEGISVPLSADGVLIFFEDDFVNRADFLDDAYTFKLQIETQDGLQLSSELTIPVDL